MKPKPTGTIPILATLATGACSSATTVTPSPSPNRDASALHEAMLFGATGKVGGGVLQALVEDASVKRIYVVTRRTTQYLQDVAQGGKAKIILHSDYLDYTHLAEAMSRVSAVYWALGVSATKVDDTTYTKIHLDFPTAFVDQWLLQEPRPRFFHLVTGAGTSPSSWFHWARVKANAERQLTEKAKGTGLCVIAYRPGVIIPTEETVRDGNEGPGFFGRTLFRSVHAAHLGQSMVEVTLRGDELINGTIVNHESIKLFAQAYRRRSGQER